MSRASYSCTNLTQINNSLRRACGLTWGQVCICGWGRTGPSRSSRTMWNRSHTRWRNPSSAPDTSLAVYRNGLLTLNTQTSFQFRFIAKNSSYTFYAHVPCRVSLGCGELTVSTPKTGPSPVSTRCLTWTTHHYCIIRIIIFIVTSHDEDCGPEQHWWVSHWCWDSD